MAIRAAYKVKSTMTKLFTSKHSENENINSVYSLEVIQMAHAHIMYVTFKNFLTHLESHAYKCPKVKENLVLLAKVYALHELTLDSTALYETGYFTLGVA